MSPRAIIVGCSLVWVGGCLVDNPAWFADADAESTSTGQVDSTTQNSGGFTAATTSGGGGSTTTGSAQTSGTGPPDLGSERPSVIEFEDVLAEDFDLGAHEGTLFSDGLRIPRKMTAGTFESRVFDATTADATWTQLRWAPRGPYGKPLPNEGASETHYALGNADLSQNVLLMHMDLDRSERPSGLVPDRSGRTHNGFVSAGAIEPVLDAPFHRGAGIGGGAFVSIPVSESDDFQFGSEAFTWSLWARSVAGCRGDGGVGDNQVYIGIDSTVFPSHMWLGCSNPAFGACAGPENGLVGGTLSTSEEEPAGDESQVLCAEGEHADSRWHHVVLVKGGDSDPIPRLWIDAEPRFVGRGAVYPNPFVFDPEDDLIIGGLLEGFSAAFEVDEVAIYRRGLSEQEVGDLYRRGALTVKLQVRGCPTELCDGVGFVGPDGTGDSFFVDQSVGDGPTVVLSGISGRFFQYRLTMTSVSVQPSPVVDAVQITAER